MKLTFDNRVYDNIPAEIVTRVNKALFVKGTQKASKAKQPGLHHITYESNTQCLTFHLNKEQFKAFMTPLKCLEYHPVPVGLLAKANKLLAKEARKLQASSNDADKRLAAQALIKTLAENIPVIEEAIGYSFNKKVLLMQAFFSKGSHLCNGLYNNGDLEFLGDRIIYGIAAQKLIEEYASFTKAGQIDFNMSTTKLTYKCEDKTSNKFFEKCIVKRGLDTFMVRGGVHQGKPVANLFETIIGAVAIDSDYNFAELVKVYDNLTK